MRIGEFSTQFNLQPETVRYYVNMGLLCPLERNKRYDFNEQDCEDMSLLLKLKSYRFSIVEIHKLLSLRRLSNFDSPNELSDYLALLQTQKKELVREKENLQGLIVSLQNEIRNTSGKHTTNIKEKKGVPLKFLSIFYCPHCQLALSLNNCTIENNQILSGVLSCHCGFSVVIQNGILIGPAGEVSQYDWPDRERNCYRLMNPTLVSYMQKSYHWLLEKLKSQNMAGKVILEDFINNYCFCHANIEEMPADALYIITDKYPELVAIYKGLIDKLGLERDILYVATASSLLPLKENSVDLYIDFDSANEYALFHKGYSLEAVSRYLKPDSCAMGAFFSFDQKSPSVTELHHQYPEAWDRSYDNKHFKLYMKERWEHVAFEEIGNVIDVEVNEQASLYHIPGVVDMDVYYANKLNNLKQ